MGTGAEGSYRRIMSTHTYEPQPANLHSPSWIAMTKIQFGIASGAMAIGLWYLPVEPWIVAYLSMSTLLLLTSAVSLTKTLRDVHEGGRIVSRVEQARIDRLLSAVDPTTDPYVGYLQAPASSATTPPPPPSIA